MTPPSLLRLEDAVKIMANAAKTSPVEPTKESLKLRYAVNRIVAKDIISAINIPLNDNAAMDGYALKASNLADDKIFKVAGTAYAGNPYTKPLATGECVRIMTGAEIPPNADAVIMKERATVTSDSGVSFTGKVSSGANIRKRAEGVAADSAVITKGTRLTPRHLALIASIGVSSVDVFKKLTVGVFATGNELVEPGTPLRPGQNYESNRVSVSLLLEQLGVNVIDYGIIPDDQHQLRETLRSADARCDVVISSGGISVGDADYMKEIVNQMGNILFWKVAIKPGKPFTFGRLTHSWFCGLPGNPVAAFVILEQLVSQFIKALQQTHGLGVPVFDAIANVDIEKTTGRVDCQRGYFTTSQDGVLKVTPNEQQSSAVLLSLTQANCYIVLDHECDGVKKGHSVRIQPFSNV